MKIRTSYFAGGVFLRLCEQGGGSPGKQIGGWNIGADATVASVAVPADIAFRGPAMTPMAPMARAETSMTLMSIWVPFRRRFVIPYKHSTDEMFETHQALSVSACRYLWVILAHQVAPWPWGWIEFKAT